MDKVEAIADDDQRELVGQFGLLQQVNTMCEVQHRGRGEGEREGRGREAVRERGREGVREIGRKGEGE